MVNPLHGLLGLLVGAEGEPANWRGRSALSLSLSAIIHTEKGGEYIRDCGGEKGKGKGCF